MMSATAVCSCLLPVILIGVLNVRFASGDGCSLGFKYAPITIDNFYNQVLYTRYTDIKDKDVDFVDLGQDSFEVSRPGMMTVTIAKNMSTSMINLATFDAFGETMAIFTRDPSKYIVMVLCQSISLNDWCCNGSYMIYPAVAKGGPTSVDDLTEYIQATFFESTY